jgi:dTDP-4-amino-4,6-dideoxygalactose transaminase
MCGAEKKYIDEAFATNWIAPMGPNVDGFERELTTVTEGKYVAALSSGTAAIHLSMILSGISQGDVVICQSFTFSATANPIAYQGATPVFIDSEPGTWNMDPELLEEAIINLRAKYTGMNGNGSVKAIVPVHLYGMPARMDEIIALGKKYDIPVIEDAAEAMGSKYCGKAAGTIGKLGILSFNGNKIITTSGGGALLSEDEALIKRARFLATQARDQAPHYQHSVIGYNYRMSNIVAGIGRGQLEVLSERVTRRRQINNWYRELFRGIPGISFQTGPSEKFFSNHWLTTITIDPVLAGTDRETLRLAFAEENIEARPLWKPMHLQPVFAHVPRFVNGTSERLFNNGLCLPSGSNLTENEFERIAGVIKKVFKINYSTMASDYTPLTSC